MHGVMEILLWAWIILDSGVFSASLPEITDGKFIDECVREHNKARSSVSPTASDMLYMTWDKDLARTASEWARHCLFEHNPQRKHPSFSYVGENIWTGYPPSFFDVARAMKKWMDEEKDYNYSSNGCTNICGHYTQVVWASSYKVGCAAHLCPNGVRSTNFGRQESVIFVCNYAPGGNVGGRKPYGSGAPCSGCKDCVENLCRTQGEDSRKGHNVPPFSGPANSDPKYVTNREISYVINSGYNYGTILIVRSIALIFTFITAYAVRHFYPDVFCYE